MSARLARTRRVLLLCVVALGATLMVGTLGVSAASAKSLGEWTDADVDTGITNGVNALDNLADKSDPANIHWQANLSSGDVTETGFALAAIGAARDANASDVSPAVLADAKNAVQWLIGQQDTSGTATNGSFGVSSGTSDSNYATSIALMALGFFDTEPGAANAISAARTFEIMWQNAPPSTTGNPASNCTPPAGSSYGNCGSWTYSPTSACCGDGSNTGFGVTGLDFSGGVPGPTAAANLAWAKAVQEISSNPYATQNDGGGSYLPGITFAPFRSSANGTGTMLFEFAYDGLPVTDPAAQTGIQAATDMLDVYELSKSASPRSAIYHQGVSRDTPCTVDATGCNYLTTHDGGYHYSLFAISKGMGSYIVPTVTDSTNFYAKVADLLLGEQATDGTWPVDPRDDGSQVGATAFAILALAKAGQLLAVTPAATPTTSTSSSSTSETSTTQTQTVPQPTPTPAACDDTRRFAFKLHHGRRTRIVKVVVFVNGRKVVTRRGRNIGRVSISPLPQSDFTVRIVTTHSNGSKLISSRRYSGCSKGKPKTKARHHRKKHKKSKK
jgi:hypothetical protein